MSPLHQIAREFIGMRQTEFWGSEASDQRGRILTVLYNEGILELRNGIVAYQYAYLMRMCEGSLQGCSAAKGLDL